MAIKAGAEVMEAVVVEKTMWGGLLRRIPEGGLYPRGYGYAWREWSCGNAWTAPIPLNLVISGVRRFWYALKGGVRPGRLEQAEGVCKLYRTRLQRCYEQGHVQKKRIMGLELKLDWRDRTILALREELIRATHRPGDKPQ